MDDFIPPPPHTIRRRPTRRKHVTVQPSAGLIAATGYAPTVTVTPLNDPPDDPPSRLERIKASLWWVSPLNGFLGLIGKLGSMLGWWRHADERLPLLPSILHCWCRATGGYTTPKGSS